MKLNELLDTVTEASSRPQGRQAEVGAALALTHRAIEESGIEVNAAYSRKGSLTLEVKRGPVCKLEQEYWPRVLQYLARNWELTALEPVVELYAEDGFYHQEIAESLNDLW